MRLVVGREITSHTITQVSFEPLTTTLLLVAKHVISLRCSRNAGMKVNPSDRIRTLVHISDRWLTLNDARIMEETEGVVLVDTGQRVDGGRAAATAR